MKISFKRRSAETPPGYVSQTFAVHNMNCNSCAMSIDWAVEALDGVAESNTSYADAQMTVVFDPTRLTAEAVAAAVDRAGFRAEPIA